jgi:shikimate dehydrogenase
MAMILGTGGASRAVKAVLQDLGIIYAFISRDPATFIRETGERCYAYTDLSREVVSACRLIINTTPLGTSPDVEGKPPIPYAHLSAGHFLHDLVYNPEQTAFMQAGAARGAKVKNGYEMLVLQAEKSWEIWNS